MLAVPADLADALEREDAALRSFERLSYDGQARVVLSVDRRAARATTRRRRIAAALGAAARGVGPVSLPEIVTEEEWLAARKELLAKEKEMTRARDALNAERRRLPMVEIDQGLRVRGPAGQGRRWSTCSRAGAS